MEKVRYEYEKVIQERNQKQELIEQQNKQIAEQKAELEKLDASAKTEKNRADKLSGQLENTLSELEALKRRIAKSESGTTLDVIPIQKASNIVDDEIEHNAEESIDISITLPQRLKGGNTNWPVEEESLDDDQLDLIDHTINSSMLVSGCAGSGKSVIGDAQGCSNSRYGLFGYSDCPYKVIGWLYGGWLHRNHTNSIITINGNGWGCHLPIIS